MPKFTKKHYKAIADMINGQLKLCIAFKHSTTDMARLIDSNCEIFAKDNPRFRREQFLDTCWKGVI